MPELNTMLMEQVMTFIRDNPEQHDQTQWAGMSEDSPCGTTACFAGHALLMSGQYHTESIRSESAPPIVAFRKNTAGAGHPLTIDVHDEARELLGLNYDEAWCLFYSGTSPHEPPLEEAYKDVMNGKFR